MKNKDPSTEKYLKYHEDILEGMKQVSDELKKKGIKGKEGNKKAFEELVNKHIYKMQDQLDLRLFGNQQVSNEENNLKILDYMLKNGLIRMPDLTNNKVFAEGLMNEKLQEQKDSKEKQSTEKTIEIKQENSSNSNSNSNNNKGNKGK